MLLAFVQRRFSPELPIALSLCVFASAEIISGYRQVTSKCFSYLAANLERKATVT